MVREEFDTLGKKEVPEAAYYGIQTARALENFPITGERVHPRLIHALGLVKWAAARVLGEMGLLPPKVAAAIRKAAREVADGRFDGEFVVDPIQGGAGTSLNMNANEVIANRAGELLGARRGSYRLVHPTAHVNMAQSTNDVVPTALRIALLQLGAETREALAELVAAFEERRRALAGIVKVGRTHLQDGVPIRLDQELGAYSGALRRDLARLEAAADGLCAVNLGGTAVGTGLNAPAGYAQRAVALLREETGLPLRQADDLVDATQNQDPLVAFSAALRTCALNLAKIASDLRLLASGPRAGIGELRLPPVQPGSTIMPAKVNPVLPEVVNQVAMQVQGCDCVVGLAAQAGQLELNVFLPVLAYNLLKATELLGRAARVFARRAVAGLEVDAARCRELVGRTASIATALSPYIGYEAAGRLVQDSLKTGRPVRDLALERGLLPASLLDEILAPEHLTRPRS